MDHDGIERAVWWLVGKASTPQIFEVKIQSFLSGSQAKSSIAKSSRVRVTQALRHADDGLDMMLIIHSFVISLALLIKFAPQGVPKRTPRTLSGIGRVDRSALRCRPETQLEEFLTEKGFLRFVHGA